MSHMQLPWTHAHALSPVCTITRCVTWLVVSCQHMCMHSSAQGWTMLELRWGVALVLMGWLAHLVTWLVGWLILSTVLVPHYLCKILGCLKALLLGGEPVTHHDSSHCT